MKTRLLNYLICPSCIPLEIRLEARCDQVRDEDITEGVLVCNGCNARYPISEGIAFLVPNADKDDLSDFPYEWPSWAGSYLWSHYADLLEDPDVHAAYREWAGLIEQGPGMALDAGCAVGRFTFEMGRSCDFAVGVDRSHTFIRNARRFMKEGHVEIAMPEEGRLLRNKTVYLPEEWRNDRVEFIVADAQKLPFFSGTFSVVGSLNLVDKIPLPLVHLREIDRTAKKNKAQFLFSDPFSWSIDVANEADWLGGTDQGPFAGSGIENIERLFSGVKGGFVPAWKIQKKGYVWWKLRNHINHFELIRSWYLKGRR